MGVIIPGASLDKRAVGTILADGVEVARTMQCIHCGFHWIWQPGSGKSRPWCIHCQGFSCGKPECVRPMPHKSFKQKLEEHHSDPAKNKLD
jgi:hypothetical protein